MTSPAGSDKLLIIHVYLCAVCAAVCLMCMMCMFHVYDVHVTLLADARRRSGISMARAITHARCIPGLPATLALIKFGLRCRSAHLKYVAAPVRRYARPGRGPNTLAWSAKVRPTTRGPTPSLKPSKSDRSTTTVLTTRCFDRRKSNHLS